MATQGRIPKPYVSDVPMTDGGDAGMMQYVSFPNMGIGARKSGMPNMASDGPKGLDHVGGNASGGKK